MTHWSLSTTTTQAWDMMLDACRKATVSIDFEQFIFVDDGIGRKFLDVCIEKAKQGVRVRLLWDTAGSFSLFGNFLVASLSQQGVQVAFFNTFIPRSLQGSQWWFFRNHRRLLLIDDMTAFTGSGSIWKSAEHWRDNIIKIDGPIIPSMKAAFEVMWSRAHSIKADWGKVASPTVDGFAYVTNSPVPGKQFLYHQIIDAIRNAKSYICISTPYFVPDRRLIRVLRLAARRGIELQILLPRASDHPVVDRAGRSFFHTLLKAGVKIYQHNGPLLHAKSVVIDDDWATTGTMNFDHVSLHYNFEANIVSTDSAFVHELKTTFYKDVESATLLTLEAWNARSFPEKWSEFIVRFIRTIL